MSDFLHFSEHTLQEAALIFMTIVYILRLRWLLSFKAGKERQAPTGAPDTMPRKGIIYSWANIATPWTMESTRTKFFTYLQFVIFHVGVTVAIGLSFIIPYWPEFLEVPLIISLLRIVIGAAFIVGIMRIIRRIGNLYMRAISTPDDYFSLFLLIVWFFFAFLSVPNSTANGEWHLLTYFILTAFFLVYVPFSKISHYLYYPFTRYYFGKTMGHRGIYPVKHVPEPKQ